MYQVTEENKRIYASQQLGALNEIYSRFNAGSPVETLAGRSGSGKSTLMEAIGNSARSQGHKVIQICPTGKAAVRLAERTGHKASTAHSCLYGGAEEDENGELVWIDPGITGRPGDLVIMDEASMSGRKLTLDLEEAVPRGMQILYVGDPFQLSPVGDTPGVDFSRAAYTLTDIHRQAQGNPILDLGTAAIEHRPIEYLKEVAPGLNDDRLRLFHGIDTFIERAVNHIKSGVDLTAVCYTNDFRRELNQRIREGLGRRQLLEPGDRIVIRTNNAQVGVYNGETYIVDKVKYYTDKTVGAYVLVHLLGRKTPVKISTRHFGCNKDTWWNYIKYVRKNVAKNYVHADYGFALTAHNCQGSEWNTVMHFWEPALGRMLQYNQDECMKWLYTAWTRAQNNLELYR